MTSGLESDYQGAVRLVFQNLSWMKNEGSCVGTIAKRDALVAKAARRGFGRPPAIGKRSGCVIFPDALAAFALKQRSQCALFGYPKLIARRQAARNAGTCGHRFQAKR